MQSAIYLSPKPVPAQFESPQWCPYQKSIRVLRGAWKGTSFIVVLGLLVIQQLMEIRIASIQLNAGLLGDAAVPVKTDRPTGWFS